MKNLISLRLQVWSLWTLKVESESQRNQAWIPCFRILRFSLRKFLYLPSYYIGQEVSSQHFSCRSPLLLPSFHFVYEWSKKIVLGSTFLLSWMCRFTIIIYLFKEAHRSSPQAQRTISTVCLNEKQKCFLCCSGSGCLRRFQVG